MLQKKLRDEVSFRVRAICRHEDVEILKGHVSQDHIHLFVSIPPQVTVSRFMQRLNGKTALPPTLSKWTAKLTQPA